MKYLTLIAFGLMLIAGVEVRAQVESSTKRGSTCDQYKVGIITPSKEVDFKLKTILPPQNLDQAMVLNVCPEQNQVASAFQITGPRRQTREFFGASPLMLHKKYFGQTNKSLFPPL